MPVSTGTHWIKETVAGTVNYTGLENKTSFAIAPKMLTAPVISDVPVQTPLQTLRTAKLLLRFSFKDISQDNWHYDAVKYIYEKQLFSGTADGTFSLDIPMTKGMLTAVLRRLAGNPPSRQRTGFL